MMKLILSLTLIWTLSSTAEAVDCWTGHTKQQELLPCNSTELCATFAFQGYGNGTVTQDTIRFCLSSSIFSEGNHTFSFNDGFGGGAASVHMCNTDGCNSEIIPHPGVQEKNNLQCFTCDDQSSSVCNKTLQCVGEQDRCFSRTVVYSEDRGAVFHSFGCISANLCKVASHLELLPVLVKFSVAPKCCESSFCNSAWSVKLNVTPLLFGLITLIIY
ncbi:urokinase plasminogen activator surface receptor-like isoform X1 [Thunnus albacares]|uniref:urokinase plasminogen activator surface receptor-like isoform X1 n=1 Tax=Thunnus albacares TaxID=8236 RepID=UPI001CF6988F|nr:urokinase plasminogen activator surface receptor-like isoform X1 [Thunnus albacares]